MKSTEIMTLIFLTILLVILLNQIINYKQPSCPEGYVYISRDHVCAEGFKP